MLIYPAIDLRNGRVVRLTQGDYDRMTVYSDDPAAVAQGFVQAGAACLHAVDLDGAKDGSPRNRAVIGRLCKLPLSVEVGGGMRTEADVEATLALGTDRVILGTAAVEVIYTDIGRDGALSGTNLDVYARLSGIAGLQVIASGGVSFESEIAALRDMGLYGCILGKALYAGKLKLERALAIARGEAEPC